MGKKGKRNQKGETSFGLFMFLLILSLGFPLLFVFNIAIIIYWFGLFRSDWNKFKYWKLKDKLKVLVFVFLFSTILGGSGVKFFSSLPIPLIFLLCLLGLTIYGVINVFKLFFIKHLPTLETIDQVDKMDGIEFENYLGKLYRKLGYFSEVTKSSGDFGADVILKKGKDKIVVQAKCNGEGNNVGVDAINEVVGAAGFYNANKKIVVTNRFYTENAKIQARANNVKLVNRDSLIMMIREAIDKKGIATSTEPNL
ncbi:restriction endonuclease [Bacillus solitudinis]|uniref:restriction endonuclease n=1 Tax=Bacillus solitudinis TaxID=2014074 RepID=UPI001D0D5E27|nr:restriction endonuclease [Bacillus solitudinis]